MKSNPRQRALALVVIGLFGMAAYQVVLHLNHPPMMEKDLFHGMWFGICLGLEVTGIYLLSKNRSAA